MNLTPIRTALIPGVAALALVLSACGASNEEGSDTGGSGGSSAGSDSGAAWTGLSGELKGGGSTAQEKAQEAWKTNVQGANDGNLTIDYALLGSTDGRSQFEDGALSFAGSDSYLSDDEGELSKAKERCGGEDPIEVPAYVSSIAVAYNLPGVDELNLDAPTIAQIFDNKITKWNDPAIQKLNPDADLPSTTISPVHRSDDSGTTKNFTDYLYKAAPQYWKYEPDDPFPVQGGLAAEGTSGVVKTIGDTEGAIGYADASQTGDLTAAKVKVGDQFVAPSPEGAANTVAKSPAVKGRPDVDMAVDIDRTIDDPSAYPVILASYIIACQTYDDPEEAANVKGYVSYIVSDEGQQAAAQYAGSAPLAEDTAKRAQEIVAQISAN